MSADGGGHGTHDPGRGSSGAWARTLEQLLGEPLGRGLSEGALQHLVDDAVPEGTQLDYKAPRYQEGDDGRYELAKDVCAFANHQGGIVILGVPEKSGNKGLPGRLKPLAGVGDPDARHVRLVIADWCAPRPEVDVVIVRSDANPDDGFIVIVVPPSPWAPHAITPPGKDTFTWPIRRGAQTLWLTESELADAYRGRASRVADEAARLDQLIDEGVRPLEWRDPWLVTAVVPAGLRVAGTVDLQLVNEYTAWLRATDRQIPPDLALGRQPGGVAGPRRVIFARVDQPGKPYSGDYVELHTDGASLAGDAGTRSADLARQGDLRRVGVVCSSAGRDDVVVDAEVDIRYAISGDARLAFRVRAGGPHQMVWVPSWISNQDLDDLVTQPLRGPLFERLSSFATCVSYDHRGMGLSDPVSLADLPTLEGWTDDLHAVVTAAGLEGVVLCGHGTAGSVAMLYAATRPEQTRALILINSFAAMARSDDYEAGTTPEERERVIAWVEHVWGSGRNLRATMPDVHVDDAQLRELARIERQSMPPAVVAPMLRQVYATDVRAVLPAITAPTLVLHTAENRIIPIEHGRYLARHIPNARLVELPGADLQLFLGSAVGAVVIDEIEEFLTGTRGAADTTRMLTTLLFTDVVGSTVRVAAVGDRAWRTVLDRHDDAVRRQLGRFSGHQEKLTGDGMLATFDGPARAIRCGTAIRDAARQIGLDVRVGIHTGEVERRGTELAGIAVHLACRVCETAQPGEVLVSRTVVDLVAGSGTTFDDRGEHELKGIPAAWRLFAVTT